MQLKSSPHTKVFTNSSLASSLFPHRRVLSGGSGIEVLVPEDGGVVDVGVTPAVEVLRVAVYAVAAVDLRHGGGHGGHGVGGRTERLRVGQRAAELDAVLIPVPPQNALHL